jgi:effector-binding domain-containing protein
VALGFFAKKTYHIERSIDIEAPRAMVFESVSQFKNMDKWSPWNELDPNMKKSYSGTDGTVGASFSWEGNKDVGAGKQTIQAIGPDRVDFLLNISEPFKADFPASFILTGDEKITKVTWTLDPVLPFPVNVWAMFTNVNNAMGKDYDRGLGNLKKHLDAILHPKYRGFEVVETQRSLQFYVGLRAVVDTANVQEFYSVNLPKTLEALKKADIKPNTPPSGLYWTWSTTSDMAAAIGIGKEQKFDSLEVFRIDSSRALVINYMGAYGGMAEAHMAIDDYIKEKNLESIPPAIEEYVTDPATEPDTSKWLTRVIYFVKPK